MLKFFSVSMPRAGHHVTEMVLRRLLGAKFKYCEFYRAVDCCRSIPCTKTSTAQSEGAIVFMQKSHDHQLNNPVAPDFDGFLIQVRDPIARAISNYELNLSTVGHAHSRAYLRFWLGVEAYYVVNFVKKWCNPSEKTLILKYEQLIEDPVAYFDSFFQRFKIPQEMFDVKLIRDAQRVFSDNKKAFVARKADRSRYYDRELFAEFGDVVKAASQMTGYELNSTALGESGRNSIRPLFEAQERRANRDLEGALAALEGYLAEQDAHILGRSWRGEILAALGRKREAEEEFQEVIRQIPSDPNAYLALAKLAVSQGDTKKASEIIVSCLEAAHDKWGTALMMKEHFGDGDLTAPASKYLSPRLSREEVITAFRIILGRDPETEDVIAAHRNIISSNQLREVLLSSAEFSKLYENLNRKYTERSQ
jgi:tetratricopeptide (TPR) repeat protein